METMGKFQRSWLLFTSSISVIAANKQLLAFPIAIAALMIVIVLFFLAPVALIPTGYSVTQVEHWQAVGNALFTETQGRGDGRPGITLTTGGMAYLAGLYLVSMFFATFFNVAFYNEILAALEGDSVSIGRGLNFASTKLKSILMWSLLACLVGLAIKTIEQRMGLIGRLVTRFIGATWSIASVFAVPIIVREEQVTNPLTTLRRSADILKRTWGEALIGYVGLSFAGTVILIGSLGLLLVALFVSIALNALWIVAVVAVFLVLCVLLFGYLSSVAGQVYRGALYLYAADGRVAQPYSSEMLDSAWKFKKN